MELLVKGRAEVGVADQAGTKRSGLIIIQDFRSKLK
jgi:hypothetical protein